MSVGAPLGRVQRNDRSSRPFAEWVAARRFDMWGLLLLAIVAIATRASGFGNPILHNDDQFYLLVGRAIDRGQLPYVDIWDRKPIGLFLIYTAIAQLGGTGVEQYQIVAGLFAIGTAFIIAKLGSRLAHRRGALLAGAVYIATLVPFGGQGGQSPVFYNALIASAALCFVRAVEGRTRLRTAAALSMLACGLAMTVKQISFVEGSFIGVSFVILAFRRGRTVAQTSALAAGMIVIALAPTLLAAIFYASKGELDSFVFANFISIFRKSGGAGMSRLAGILFFIIFALPLAIGAVVCAARRHRRLSWSDPATNFMSCWMIASAVGVVAIPNFYDHYYLPLLVPLCVSAAPLFSSKRGPALAAAFALWAWSEGSMGRFADNRRGRIAFEGMAEVVNRNRHGGCVYVAGGPPLLYDRTGECRLTKYLFGEHLMAKIEEKAVGVNQQVEIARILAQRPAIIVRRTYPTVNDNARSAAIVEAALYHFYRRIDVLRPPVERNFQQFEIWQRRDLAPPAN